MGASFVKSKILRLPKVYALTHSQSAMCLAVSYFHACACMWRGSGQANSDRTAPLATNKPLEEGENVEACSPSCIARRKKSLKNECSLLRLQERSKRHKQLEPLLWLDQHYCSMSRSATQNDNGHQLSTELSLFFLSFQISNLKKIKRI